ncbi:MAG: EAL domain-containing protein [Acidimicrobiia bacterium]|nr:EAL domain-containing protein [Acidimicrobiia bacterium]
MVGRWRWALAAAGSVAAIAGRALLVGDGSVLGRGLLVGGAVIVLAALLLVAERKRAARDGQGTIDTIVVAVGGVAFTWQLAYGVSRQQPDTDLATLLVPLLGALAVAAVARLVFASLPPQPAGRYLAAGGLLVTAGTTLQLVAIAASVSGGEAVAVGLAVAGWGLVSGGLVHPELGRLSAPGLAPPVTVSRSRLAVLGASQVAGPAGAALNHVLDLRVDVAGLALCSAVTGLLVLTRVVFLVGDVERARAATGRRDRWYRQLVKHSADVLVVVDRDGRLQFASPAIEEATGTPPGEVLGRGLAELVHPDDVADLERAVEALRRHEGPTPRLVQVRLRNTGGAERWTELSLSDRLDDLAVEGIVINARDVTAKRRREAEQAAIAAVGRAALAGTDMAGLAELAVRQIELALGVDACELYRVAPSEGTLLLEAAVGPLEPAVGELVLEIGADSGPGYAVQLGEAVLSNDLGDEARFDTRPQRQLGLASAVSIIVRGHAQVYGVLTISSRRPYAFGDHELTFLSWMGNELALTLERRSAEEETRHQALHDALTGLPNRVMFLNRLGLVSARAAERERLLGVLFLDLDHFKLVNDSLGHNAGDQLLVQVSRRLRDAMRPSDLVARFGGDEFVVLCEELESVDQAEAIAARVRENMDPPFSLSGTEVHVSASIGIAVMGASPDPEALLRDADAAMYKAKERGRARYEIFDFTMRDKALARLQTASALHRAVELDQLVVHYQPIVRLATGERVGAEALVRWEHPEWGLMRPERFIAIAEQSGLIDDVASYVLEQACRAIATWQREIGPQLHLVSVNLSATQLSQPWLGKRISELIDETGADPRHLCLEITESAVMSDVARSMRVLGELRELGVRVAVDDFGTGYSSLWYLRKLPLDLLKVDREFVRGLVTNPEDRAITQTIVTLAHRLGLEAVAEGVEVRSQVSELLPLACDFAQGYHFGEAVPFEAMKWRTAPVTVR